LVVLQEPLDIGSISTLLSLDFDVLHYMKGISSLIVEGTEPLTEMTVPRVHKSVVDYLVSGSCPHPDLHIDPTEHHHSLTTACFETMQKELTFNVGRITTSHELGKISSISPSQGITYSCRWLGRHLENGGERATLVPDIGNFMKTHFLQWLEVLSLQKLVGSVAVSTLMILEEQIKVSIHCFTKYGY
jgi:hypothetical protein